MGRPTSPLLILALTVILAILLLGMDPVEGAKRKKAKEEERQRERNTMDKLEELEGKKQQPKKEEEKKSEEEKEAGGGGGRNRREEHRHRRHRAVHGEGEGEKETGGARKLNEEEAEQMVKQGLEKQQNIGGMPKGKAPPSLPLPLPEPRLENLARAMRQASHED